MTTNTDRIFLWKSVENRHIYKKYNFAHTVLLALSIICALAGIILFIFGTIIETIVSSFIFLLALFYLVLANDCNKMRNVYKLHDRIERIESRLKIKPFVEVKQCR